MVNFPINNSRTSGNWILSRSLIIGTLSAASIIFGWVPSLSVNPTLSLAFDTSAHAQNANEVQAAARTIWEYEHKRRELMNRIEAIIGSKNVPDIACNSNNQPQISGTLPRNAMPLAQQLCNEYSSAIQRNGMTRVQFETILRNMNTNNDLKRRIEQALIELQG